MTLAIELVKKDPQITKICYHNTMISVEDKQLIQQLAKKYQATKVVLFGSCLQKDQESNDIDLAVEGVAHEKFFAFYGELIFSLSKPVDLIDLSTKSKFNDLVRKNGIPVYE